MLNAQQVVKYLFEFFVCCSHFEEISPVPTTLSEFLIFNSDVAFQNQSVDDFIAFLDFYGNSAGIKKEILDYNPRNIEDLFLLFYKDLLRGEMRDELRNIQNSLKPKERKALIIDKYPTSLNELINLDFFLNYLKKNYVSLKGTDVDSETGKALYMKGPYEFSGGMVLYNTDYSESPDFFDGNLVSQISFRTTYSNPKLMVGGGFGLEVKLINESTIEGTPENRKKGVETVTVMEANSTKLKLYEKKYIEDSTDWLRYRVYGLELDSFYNEVDAPFMTFEGFKMPRYDLDERQETSSLPKLDLMVQSHHLKKAISYKDGEVKTGATWINGKPIYRKVIELDKYSTRDISPLIPGFEKIIKSDFTTYIDGNEYRGNILSGSLMAGYIEYTNTTEFTFRRWVDNTIILTDDIEFELFEKIQIIVEYTKTID